jgi:hypothetical protein
MTTPAINAPKRANTYHFSQKSARQYKPAWPLQRPLLCLASAGLVFNIEAIFDQVRQPWPIKRIMTTANNTARKIVINGEPMLDFTIAMIRVAVPAVRISRAGNGDAAQI